MVNKKAWLLNSIARYIYSLLHFWQEGNSQKLTLQAVTKNMPSNIRTIPISHQ